MLFAIETAQSGIPCVVAADVDREHDGVVDKAEEGARRQEDIQMHAKRVQDIQIEEHVSVCDDESNPKVEVDEGVVGEEELQETQRQVEYVYVD